MSFKDTVSSISSSKSCTEMRCSWLHRSLNDFRRDGSYCDVNIRVQNTTTMCHRVILASVSDLFNIMFCGTFNESNKKEIVLHEIDPLAFECVLEYAYLGQEPDFSKPTNNVYDILKACDFLRISYLVELCISHIIEHTSLIENVCEIFVFSSICHYPRLGDVLGSYIADNFHMISQNEEFYALSFEQLHIVMENYQLLKGKSVESSVFNYEDLLLDAIIRWTFRVFQERKKYFLELMSVVEIEKVSKNYLDFLLNEYQMNLGGFVNLESCLKAFFALETRHAPLAVVYSDPLKNSALHVYVKLYHHDVRALSVSKYHPKFQWSSIEWKNLGSLENELLSYSVQMVAFDEPYNYLYCLSLKKLSFSSYSTVSFNRKKTLKVPLLNLSTYTRMCGFQNDSIYLYDCNKSSAENIISYKCELDEWFMVPKMKTSLYGANLIADSRMVYSVGGKDSNEIYYPRYVQAFDYRIPRWMELTKLKSDVSDYILCCHLNGKVYASDVKKIEVFDSVAGKWRILSYNNYVFENKPIRIREMVPFENKLWIFYADILQFRRKLIIFDPHALTWLPFDSFQDLMGFGSFMSSHLNTVVFKPLDRMC